ncbi:MAG: TIGR01459 family HAD-type hydrolase [Parvularculaceae bacterium]|nr:TIGR01459 family HAD-type hydrolase [Parvularculaceae bacterium]
MSAPALARLSAIADRYDALFCDAWGVIHDGVRLFGGVAEALVAFRKTRGPVVILTNAPRPSSVIPAQLDRIGLPRDAYDAVTTSGDATRALIAAKLPQPALKIGPGKDDPLFEGLPIEFVGAEDAAFVICTGLRDEVNEHPSSYRAELEGPARRGAAMVCANPDRVVNWGGRMIWCAGALADVYEDLGGAVEQGGKPYAPIYDLAHKAAEKAAGRALDRRRILAVGDGLHTDILGANRNGLDVVYVAGAGGVHEGATDADAVAALLAREGLVAVASMESLRW